MLSVMSNEGRKTQARARHQAAHNDSYLQHGVCSVCVCEKRQVQLCFETVRKGWEESEVNGKKKDLILGTSHLCWCDGVSVSFWVSQNKTCMNNQTHLHGLSLLMFAFARFGYTAAVMCLCARICQSLTGVHVSPWAACVIHCVGCRQSSISPTAVSSLIRLGSRS